MFKSLLQFTIFITFALFLCFSQNNLDLQKMRTEYESMQKNNNLLSPSSDDGVRGVDNIGLPSKASLSPYLIELVRLDSINSSKLFFGYDFFTKRDSIAFWENLPTPPNYLLGPGDELIVSIWGETQLRKNYTVSREGSIYDDKVGLLFLTGMTIEDGKKYLLNQFGRVYATLNGNKPSSFIDLSLGSLRSINVNFVGEVNFPGVHPLHPFSNVITGLIQAGGVDIKGSLRDVRVIRNEKTIASIDIYNYIISGRALSDIRLMDQDIVHVPPRKSTIPITGRVLKPGYYEVLKEESIKTLLNFAGGIDRGSSGKIFLYKDAIESEDGYIIENEDALNHFLSNGDSLHLPIKPEIESFIQIQGQIKNPGIYPFNINLNLRDIIDATMSLKDKDFSKTMDLSKINIFRKNSSGSEPLRIATTIDENIGLKNGDHITVARKNMNHPIESVKITGEINIPGIYPVNSLTTLAELISLSGGLSNNALKDGVEIFRDSLKIGWESETIILESGDSLNVLKKTGLIFVDGEVNVPGYLSFKRSDSVKKYIRRAGGFTSFANKQNIFVKYPNGTSSSLSKWSSPKVTEGSMIFVNQRTISMKEDASGWDIFSNIFSQTGNIATTIITLSILASQQNSGN